MLDCDVSEEHRHVLPAGNWIAYRSPASYFPWEGLNVGAERSAEKLPANCSPRPHYCSAYSMQRTFDRLGLLRCLQRTCSAVNGHSATPTKATGALIEVTLTQPQPFVVPTLLSAVRLDMISNLPQLQSGSRPSCIGLIFNRHFSTGGLAVDAPSNQNVEESKEGGSKSTGASSGEDKAQSRKRTKGQAMQAPLMAQQRRMKITTVSPNLLAEPYRGEPPRLPWTALFRLAGWKEWYRRALSSIKSVYTLAKCRRNMDGFELRKFKSEALRIYLNVNQMIAAGERNKLQHIVTPGEMTNVKKQLRAREQGGWKRIAWSLATEPQLGDLELIRGRLLALDPKDEDQMFAQLTVRVRARHRFAAFDTRGQVVAGDLAAEFPVQDIWVFEHAFRKSAQAKWRVAGRLGGIPPVSPRTSFITRIGKLFGGQPRTN